MHLKVMLLFLFNTRALCFSKPHDRINEWIQAQKSISSLFQVLHFLFDPQISHKIHDQLLYRSCTFQFCTLPILCFCILLDREFHCWLFLQAETWNLCWRRERNVQASHDFSIFLIYLFVFKNPLHLVFSNLCSLMDTLSSRIVWQHCHIRVQFG